MNLPTPLRNLLALSCLAAFAGCGSPSASTDSGSGGTQFTHGNVTLNLKKGITTQEEVLRLFGAPNIATVDSAGQEVWSYQKYATVSKSSTTDGFFTIVVAGVSRSSGQTESSTKTMTLIIKFNQEKVVTEFSSFTSSF
jgi:outer membrane protein assembly factor BamE (lipoprotein component of BamABCDE complex)